MTGIIQRFFRKPGSETSQETDNQAGETSASSAQETQPLEQITPPSKPFSPPQFLVGCGHSAGIQRDHNEDALFTLTTTLVSDSNHLPFGLYIVADGMGGHQHGEMASGIAVRAMASDIIDKLYSPLFRLTPAPSDGSLTEIMEAGIQAAHRAIIEQTPGGGSTMTAVLLFADRMTIAHVGDSRAYMINADGSLQVLTRDHSLVKRLVELGQITTDEAAVHPQRNVLYRALGQGEPIDAEITSVPLPAAGDLLICSDGLWGLVSEEEIVRAVASSASPAVACQALVEAANAAGGPDNITAILVHLSN